MGGPSLELSTDDTPNDPPTPFTTLGGRVLVYELRNLVLRQFLSFNLLTHGETS